MNKGLDNVNHGRISRFSVGIVPMNNLLG